MKTLLIIISIVLLYSCYPKKPEGILTDEYKENDFERIGYPVKLHYIQKKGMQYLIASGTYGEAGVSICNLTLDSLEVEYYKKQLNKK